MKLLQAQGFRVTPESSENNDGAATQGDTKKKRRRDPLGDNYRDDRMRRHCADDWRERHKPCMVTTTASVRCSNLAATAAAASRSLELASPTPPAENMCELGPGDAAKRRVAIEYCYRCVLRCPTPDKEGERKRKVDHRQRKATLRVGSYHPDLEEARRLIRIGAVSFD